MSLPLLYIDISNDTTQVNRLRTV